MFEYRWQSVRYILYDMSVFYMCRKSLYMVLPSVKKKLYIVLTGNTIGERCYSFIINVMLVDSADIC